jgi:integrase
MSVRAIKNHGKKVWQARVAYKGLRKAAFRATKNEARTAEGELLAELKAKANASEAENQAPATLKALFDAYVEDLAARGKSDDTIARAAQTATVLERVTPELLGMAVSRIGDKEIFAFRLARAQEQRIVYDLVAGEKRPRRLAPTKPSTINRDLRTVRAMLKRARPDYRFPGGAFFKEDETRVRWLRPQEELMVLETMASPFREIAKLAALTLMRLSEIRLLRREYVHQEQGVILLPQAKAGARAVILSEAARKIVGHQLEHTKGEWLFPGPDGRPYTRVHVSRVFRKSARAAGLKDFHFHDLRHHGATMALNKGFTAPIVMALGGWKTEKMMRRYAAVTDATLRAAAEAVAGSESRDVSVRRRE